MNDYKSFVVDTAPVANDFVSIEHGYEFVTFSYLRPRLAGVSQLFSTQIVLSPENAIAIGEELIKRGKAIKEEQENG
jgi:hypothetical protein